MSRIITQNFSLKHTLESGQFFRYTKEDSIYTLSQRDITWKCWQQKNKLYFEGASRTFITNFFALGEDFDAVKNKLSEEEHLKQAMKDYSGLRIIRQDPWQCLIGFMCSICSNVPKIQKNMQLITSTFGNGPFPEPGKLNDEQKLKQCAVGFRAKYIHAANSLVTDDWLESLRYNSYQKSKQKLMEIPGIADKVADCVLLFSLGFGEAFPVDIWIERAINELYFRKKTKHDQIRAFAAKKFGTYAGYAQQYLWYSRRNFAHNLK